MGMRFAVVGVILAGVFSASSVCASPVDDFYIQQALDRYFTLPRDPKSLATADSSAMTCSDSACIFLNPAGLGTLRSVEIVGAIGAGNRTGDDFISSNEIEEDLRRGYLVLGVPLGEEVGGAPKYGALSFGYSRYAASTDDVIGSQPDGHRRSIAYGIGDSGLSGGYAFHFYDDQLRTGFSDLHSHARFLHLFGVQGELSSETRAGGVFRLGIGQSDTEYFPTNANGLSRPREYSGAIGISHDLGRATIFGALEYSYHRTRGNLDDVGDEVIIGGNEDGSHYGAQFGAQVPVVDFISVRGGFRWYSAEYEFYREELKDLSGRVEGWGGSTGFVVFFDRELGENGARIDYGVEYFTPGHGSWSHLVSLIVPL